MQKKKNIDDRVVSDFGHEWSKFNHIKIDNSSLKTSFESYFSIFPFDQLPEKAEGFDMGCGTGRWAKFVAPMTYKLNCIDPSALALNQARDNLSMFGNCIFECANASENSLQDSSQDFGYSLGVLHHTPDTYEALENCAKKLKPGAPFLLYLYYSMDNKPSWYKLLWRVSNLFRKIISKLPFPIKYFISQVIGLFIYFPLARTSLLMEKFGFDVQNFPLSDYRSKPLYILRTDALDRFGTRLEHRFSQLEIKDMLKKSGFSRITFSEKPPYWTVLAYRNSD